MNTNVVEKAKIEDTIFEVRGYQVMLATDVAKIYNSEVRIINQVVKRNLNRFPSNFCFQLTKDEYENLKSQFVISKKREYNSRGGNRFLPFAFTEYGVITMSLT